MAYSCWLQPQVCPWSAQKRKIRVPHADFFLEPVPPSSSQELDIQALGQIELCFTKDLKLRNCSDPGVSKGVVAKSGGLQVCADGPAFYPPP